MILPESLHPAMTRGGFAYRQRVPVRSEDRRRYPVSENGLWLPTMRVAQREFDAANTFFDNFEKSLSSLSDREELARAAFKGVRLHDKTGCWVASDALDEGQHISALWQIAEYDMGGEPLNSQTAEQLKSLRVCDEEGCLNARHYDFTHRVQYRDSIAAPDYADYETHEDGSVVTIWEGRMLPSVVLSIEALRRLQLQCPPYAEERKAPLSGNGISKITLDPVTGCWLVRMYYTRPQYKEMPGFQYDGYGRLGKGPAIRKKSEPAKPMLAHRVVWLASGRRLLNGKELNHCCGVRSCCNYDHIEQVSKSSNGKHGRAMADARQRKQTTGNFLAE
jgi:HNH endonuclease